MSRALETRIAKLEKDDKGTGTNAHFYLLWVAPGEDRVAARERARKAGKFKKDLLTYCAEWTGSTPRPRSRLTHAGRLSDQEVKVLCDALCYEPHVLEAAKQADDEIAAMDEHGRQVHRQRMAQYTDRELLGFFFGDSTTLFGCGIRRPNSA
jgi:hypothetical protein